MIFFYLNILLLMILSSVNMASIGYFLVLEKKSLFSDVLSHLLFPSLLLSYLIFGENASWELIIGTLFWSIFFVALNELLAQSRLLDRDTSMLLSMSGFFALGFWILSLWRTKLPHFHTEQILAGDLALASLKILRWGDLSLGPSALYYLSLMTILNALFLWIFFRSLLLAAFDPFLGKHLALPLYRIQMFFLLLVILNTILAFELLGALLVLSFMILPINFARLFWQTTLSLFWGSLAFAVLMSVAGFFVAIFFKTQFGATVVFFQMSLFITAHLIIFYLLPFLRGARAIKKNLSR